MHKALVEIQDAFLIAIDPQPGFLKVIPNANEILSKGLLLTQVAKILDTPILATTQYQEKMGNLELKIKMLIENKCI